MPMRVSWLMLSAVLALPAVALALPPQDTLHPVARMVARGDAALARGDSISAIGYYHDAIHRAPRDAAGYVALGRAYLTLREPEHARESFSAGLRSTPGAEALSLGLADAYEALGDAARALRVLRERVALGDASSVLLERLAERAEAEGALSEALGARRALLHIARHDAATAPEALRNAQIRVSALSLLLGSADRLSPAHCGERSDSALLQHLLGCR